MENLHALVRRQWQRYFGRDYAVPEAWRPFLQAVSEAYVEFDTARHMVERALALSSGELHAANSELRGVLQVLPDFLLRIAADGKVSGLMPGSSAGLHPVLKGLSAPPAATPGPIECAFWQAVEEVRRERLPFAFECSREGESGATHHEVRLFPFVEGEIIGIVRDITERKQAETALRESKERLALAQRAGRVGSFDWDVRSGHVIWSAETADIFGVLPADFGGNYQAWSERLLPEDRLRLEKFFETWLVNGREDSQWEYRIVRPDGQQRTVESRGHAMRDGSGRAVRVIGTHLDVTERKQSEQDRLVLGKLESTGVLAGGIAHDFNNLLTGMLLNIEMAEATVADPPLLTGHLTAARESLKAAQGLTQQLITFSRGHRAARSEILLGELVPAAVSLSLTGSNVRSEITIAPDLIPTEIDPAQISQAIRNLVLNAREAMPAGGVVVVRAHNIQLRAANATALPAGNYVRLQIEDTGQGIPAEILPKIFDPYFSTKTRGDQRGMGLGLTICHSIIQQHGGAIAIESTPGKGSRFDVYLPATAPVENPTPTPAATPARPIAGRILVMDDELMIRKILKQTLEQGGYAVEVSPEGRAAVELYRQEKQAGRPFDAVLLDLTIRGEMGGREAAAHLLDFDPAARLVVMSGHSADDVMHRHRFYGFKAALAKPFDRQSLYKLLAEVLGK